MYARDVMTAEVLSVTAGTRLPQIARILVEHRISGVPVIDSEGSPIGMVTEGDLIAMDADGERESGREWWLTHLADGEPLSPQFLAYLDRAERTARDVMSSPVVTVTETTELSEVARLFITYRIKLLPVVREGRIAGIVGRADLVRRIAKETAPQTPASHAGGVLTQAIASLDEHFTRQGTSPAPSAKAEEPPAPAITASAFKALAEEAGHQKAHQHDEERRAAAERRKALVKELIGHHIEDERWRDLLHRAQAAAEAGEKEMLLLRFPSELCSDGGRAINAPQPGWPETLRGEAAEIYLHWERDLKPNGFHIAAKVLDFPGGMPGDIGLILVWGR